MPPKCNRLARIVLRKTSPASPITIIARRDTSNENVAAYTRTRSLS
jgi:hypothetical protein